MKNVPLYVTVVLQADLAGLIEYISNFFPLKKKKEDKISDD